METKIEKDVAKEVDASAENENKRVSTKEIISYLAEKFPQCFSTEGPAKPLKIGIFQELADKLSEDEFISKTRLRQALRHYTSSWRYLKSVKLDAARVDADGQEVAKVDQEQADYANKTLKESQEKFGNKKAKEKTSHKSAKAPKIAKGSTDNSAKSKASTRDKKKFASVKASKRAQSQGEAKLKPVESSSVSVGKSIKVKLGNAAMDAVITEISGKDISVQLTSGMVVKTQAKNIFTE